MPKASGHSSTQAVRGLCLASGFPSGARRIASAVSAQAATPSRAGANAYTLNEVPQPQVVLALGLLNTNPLPFKPPE